MKQVLTFINVASPSGRTFPGGMTILSGDAPVWQYCVEFHKAVMEGAAVVAIAHGIDTTTNGKDSIVAYSIDPVYRIGNTFGHDNERDRLRWAHQQEATELPTLPPPSLKDIHDLIDRYGTEAEIQFWRDFEAKHLTSTIPTDIRHSELARLIEKYGVDEGFRRYRDGEVCEEPKPEAM